MTGNMAGKEFIDPFSAFRKVSAGGDDSNRRYGLVDGNKPNPGAGHCQDMNVNIFGSFNRSAIHTFEPVVDRELIEQRVVMFKPQLRAEDGVASRRVHYQL